MLMAFSKTSDGVVFEPETIALLHSALEEAWSQLTPAEQVRISKTAMAEKILQAAARGERNPVRLRASALLPSR